MIPVMLPLLISAPLLLRVGWRRLAAPLLILCATAAPWALVTMWKTGGFAQTVYYHVGELRSAFDGHSIWYEGFTGGAIIMALYAAYWNGIGGLGWLWAVPAALRRESVMKRWRQFAFLAIWFTPPFLLSAVVQVTDPDQTLASVAATCLAGAWALAALRWRWTALGCAISAGLFVFPPKQLGREASLPWIQRVAAIEGSALDGVSRAPAPRLIVIRGIYPTWRLVSYYYPEDWIQQGKSTAHANQGRDEAPPPGWRSRVVIDEQGGVQTEIVR
jgi:hypothetical protein